MRLEARSDNAKSRMSAMRAGQNAVGNMPAMQRVQAVASLDRDLHGNNFVRRNSGALSETPTLRVAHQKVTERLHARHRLELFRIDEERIERGAFFFAEQLHQ